MKIGDILNDKNQREARKELESTKERIKRNLEEYKAWYEPIFLANRSKCDHLCCGTKFKAIHGTTWQKIDNFEACLEICFKCGETVQIWLRNEKGLRKLLQPLNKLNLS